MEEELSEQKKAELRHIAQITYEATMEAVKKLTNIKKLSLPQDVQKNPTD